MAFAVVLLFPSAPIGRSETAPLRIAVVEVPMPKHKPRLKLYSSEVVPADKELGVALAQVRLRQAETRAANGFREELSRRGEFALMRDTRTIGLAEQMDLGYGDEALPRELMTRFRNATGADAMLRFRITDYGRTPRKAMKWIWIGTGAWISGATALALTQEKTRPYIGAYLASEVIQEGAEAYLGSSLFGHEYKPVRIEAELIDFRTGAALWKDAKTMTASSKSLETFSKDERRRKEVELAVSVDRAVNALVGSLVRKLGGAGRHDLDRGVVVGDP